MYHLSCDIQKNSWTFPNLLGKAKLYATLPTHSVTSKPHTFILHWLFIGINLILFNSQSIINHKISLTDLLVGNPRTKFIEILSHFHTGISNCYNQTSWSFLFTLDLLSSQTLENILSNMLFFSPPPKCMFQILIHLFTPWVYRICYGFLSRSHVIIGHTPSSFETNTTIVKMIEPYALFLTIS